jgi:hypothetical protein
MREIFFFFISEPFPPVEHALWNLKQTQHVQYKPL